MLKLGSFEQVWIFFFWMSFSCVFILFPCFNFKVLENKNNDGICCKWWRMKEGMSNTDTIVNGKK